jgi:hypothetical protein
MEANEGPMDTYVPAHLLGEALARVAGMPQWIHAQNRAISMSTARLGGTEEFSE